MKMAGMVALVAGGFMIYKKSRGKNVQPPSAPISSGPPPEPMINEWPRSDRGWNAPDYLPIALKVVPKPSYGIFSPGENSLRLAGAAYYNGYSGHNEFYPYRMRMTVS